MLSLDQSLLKDPQESQGDTFQRFQKYSPLFEEFIVLVPTHNSKAKIRTWQNIKISPCSAQGKAKFWRLFKSAQKLCREKPFDLIVTNDAILGYLGHLLKKKFGGKLNINVFGAEIYNPDWLKQRFLNHLLRFIQRRALKKTDSIRTDTTTARDLIHQHEKIPLNKIWVIPVAPDQKSIQIFSQAKKDLKLRQKYLDQDFSKLVLSVASFEKCKDIPNLLKAAQKVIQQSPQAKFLIVGDGPGREKIEKLIRKLELTQSVVLAGKIPYSKLPSYYASADLFVLSSLHEGLPRVIMEAAFAKLPVVTTDINGAQDLIKPQESGYIVPTKNPQALAEAILDILKNPAKSHQFAEKMHSHVIDYCNFDKNLEKMKQMWISLF